MIRARRWVPYYQRCTTTTRAALLAAASCTGRARAPERAARSELDTIVSLSVGASRGCGRTHRPSGSRPSGLPCRGLLGDGGPPARCLIVRSISVQVPPCRRWWMRLVRRPSAIRTRRCGVRPSSPPAALGSSPAAPPCRSPRQGGLRSAADGEFRKLCPHRNRGEIAGTEAAGVSHVAEAARRPGPRGPPRGGPRAGRS